MYHRDWMILPAVTMATLALAACANLQAPAAAPARAALPEPPAAAAPQDLRLYFDPGQSRLRPDSRAVLEQAVRLFRETDPRVMIVSGQSDTTGDPRRNLLLSQERATAVARGLMDRGVPASRLQIVAKGESEPAVRTDDDVAQSENRAVIITWRK